MSIEGRAGVVHGCFCYLPHKTVHKQSPILFTMIWRIIFFKKHLKIASQRRSSYLMIGRASTQQSRLGNQLEVSTFFIKKTIFFASAHPPTPIFRAKLTRAKQLRLRPKSKCWKNWSKPGYFKWLSIFIDSFEVYIYR